VPEALSGRFVAVDQSGATTIVDLADVDGTIELGAGNATEAKQDQIILGQTDINDNVLDNGQAIGAVSNQVATRAAPGDEMATDAASRVDLRAGVAEVFEAYEPPTRADATADKQEILDRGNAAWLTGSGGGGGNVDEAAIAGLVLAGLGGLAVEMMTPYDEKTKTLKIVQRADYKATSLIGPIRIKIESAGVQAGDVVRFGANLEGQPTIQATGVVVELNEEHFGQIELTKEDHTDRKESLHWRFELEHVNDDDDVSPLFADQPMILLPSHAEA
jgi:hypothetical protein